MSALALNGDVRLAYEVRGSGDPLLLVQGLGYGRWGWEPVADLLAEDFLVVSFDNRGIGESDVPPGPYSAAAMAGDATAVLDAVGLERAHVVGASLVCTFEKNVVVGVAGGLDRVGRRYATWVWFLMNSKNSRRRRRSWSDSRG